MAIVRGSRGSEHEVDAEDADGEQVEYPSEGGAGRADDGVERPADAFGQVGDESLDLWPPPNPGGSEPGSATAPPDPSRRPVRTRPTPRRGRGRYGVRPRRREVSRRRPTWFSPSSSVAATSATTRVAAARPAAATPVEVWRPAPTGSLLGLIHGRCSGAPIRRSRSRATALPGPRAARPAAGVR